MISSVRSASQSSSLSSAGQEGKKKLGKGKIEELMKSIRDDFDLHSRLSKFYYTKIGEKHGMATGPIAVEIGKNASKVKKIQRIVDKERGFFGFDQSTNKFTYGNSILIDEDLVKKHKKYAELRIDNISVIIRNSSSKSAQMNSGDKLTQNGLEFITAALFSSETAITNDEVVNFLAINGFSDEVIQIGLNRWNNLKEAIKINLYTDWNALDPTVDLNQMLNGVMTSTFLQGLIHLYKNIRLQKTDTGKYNVDAVFGILKNSFQAVDAKRQNKLADIMASVGNTQDNLDKLFQYAEEYNRPKLSDYQLNELNNQINKTKTKDLQTKYKKASRDATLQAVRNTFAAYASLDDKKLGRFLKTLDNFPVEGQFNNNTLLSISRSMVNSNDTNPALKPVTGEQHAYRKEVLKEFVDAINPAIKQDTDATQVVLDSVSNLIGGKQYAVAIKLINYYINVKYKLFKSLGADYLPKKTPRKKVNQTSMSIVFGD